MKSGYLAIETPPENKHIDGLIRLLTWDELPQTEETSSEPTYPENVHYIAKFNDILAASMHFHNGLRKKLEDIDEHIYRADLTEAIAVIEAEDDLRHERVWIDPSIETQDLDIIQNNIDKIRTKKQRIDKAIQMIGYIAIGILAIYGIAAVL